MSAAKSDREAIAEVLSIAFRRDTDPLALDNLHSDWAVQSVGKSLADVLLASGWLARHDARVKAEALREFTHWVATNRAYNGSDHQHGQSLYNECINAALPTWAADWIEQTGHQSARNGHESDEQGETGHGYVRGATRPHSGDVEGEA